MSRQLTHWDIVELNKMIICNDCKCEVKLGYIKRHNLTKKHIETREAYQNKIKQNWISTNATAGEL